MDPSEILKQYWGYSRFRPLQEEIVQSVLNGNDVLALLPTGGGKSICFQVPGLIRGGVCIIISPLIALMKDQVANLKKRGIKADMISSGNSYRETDILLDNAIYGDTRFLYVAPERLKNELFIERLKKMNVGLIAVDEAHCISQWGYDFRPAYLEINTIRQILPKVPVIALTATATEVVAKDIAEKLELRDYKFFRKSFLRENISYRVINTPDKNSRLAAILSKFEGSAIVYARSRKGVKETAQFLNAHGFSAGFYHAGLTAADREKAQNSWVKDETRIMVSTNAFGMGIDKPDVRMVVHLDMPPDPESYYQESGRAGRDEQPAMAVLISDKADEFEAKRRLELKYPEISTIRRVYQATGNFLKIANGSGEGQSYPLDRQLIAENFRIKSTDVFYSLQLLEKQGEFALSDSGSEGSRIMFTASKEQLYQFQVIHGNLDPFIKILLRSYGGLFENFTKIKEEDLAKRSGLGKIKVRDNLRFLQKSGLLIYTEQTDLPKITYLRPRVESAQLKISDEFYGQMKKRETGRLEAMLRYTKLSSGCRVNVLLEYFNEHPTQPCGKCDLCKGSNPSRLNGIILEKIGDGKTKMEDLVFQLNEWKEEDVIYSLRSMIDEKLIIKDDKEYISRKK